MNPPPTPVPNPVNFKTSIGEILKMNYSYDQAIEALGMFRGNDLSMAVRYLTAQSGDGYKPQDCFSKEECFPTSVDGETPKNTKSLDVPCNPTTCWKMMESNRTRPDCLGKPCFQCMVKQNVIHTPWSQSQANAYAVVSRNPVRDPTQQRIFVDNADLTLISSLDCSICTSCLQCATCVNGLPVPGSYRRLKSVVQKDKDMRLCLEEGDFAGYEALKNCQQSTCRRVYPKYTATGEAYKKVPPTPLTFNFYGGKESVANLIHEQSGQVGKGRPPLS